MRYDNRNLLLMPLFPLTLQRIDVTPQMDYQLQPNRIDIWEFSLQTLFNQAVQLLNEEESARAKRFYFPRHQRRFTMARAMLRVILGAYLQQKPFALQFQYNKYGKPYLTSEHAIEFNLSHSGDLALLAVGQQFPLGVDVEFFSARPYEDLGAQAFSLEETAEIKRLPALLKPLGFFHIWTQKEAFIKAIGLGLAYPTETFTVSTLSVQKEIIVDARTQQAWKMTAFMPLAGCCAALCYHSAVTTIRRRIIHPEVFLK